MRSNSVLNVANHFIHLYLNEKEKVPPLHFLKLKALVYYVQGWKCGIHHKPLFEEDILAYPWGPGVRNLEIAIQKTGKTEIDQYLPFLSFCSSNPASSIRWIDPTPTSVELDTPDPVVVRVWETHKDLTHIQLMNSTHVYGEPWEIVSRFFDLNQCPTIPRPLIKRCFEKKITVRKDTT